MIDIQQIHEPVSTEFKRFTNDFNRILDSETPLLQKAIKQVLRSNGKHIRPLLLLLTAKACGKITDTTYEAALLVELLHTTTLVHDDVIDETKQRRGVPSLNAIFDNRVAVLTGDYMLAGTIIRATETGDLRMVKIFAQVCRELSEGELIQLDNAEKHILDEDNYIRMIRKKTATLLSACAEIGAMTAGASSETTKQCRLFGEYLGYCFQIKDDIFDYYNDINIGKPTGNDIREGKITLPLLYALNNASATEKSRYMEIITKQDYTLENIESIINFAKRNGGIEYAESRIDTYKQQSIEIINSFPESEARQSLLLFAEYLTERKK